MHTLGYRFRPVDAGRRRSPTAPSILDYVRDTAARGRRSTGTSASATGSRGRSWSTRRRRDGRSRPAHGDGETVRFTCNFLLHVQRLLPTTTRATLPTFAGHRATSAARSCTRSTGPQDLDYAGKRVVVIGSGATAVTLVPALAEHGRARDDAAALADLHPVAARRGPASPTGCASCSATAPRVPAHALEERAAGHAVYQLSRRRPQLVRKLIRKLAIKAAARRATTSTRTSSPRYNPWDQRLCLVPDGDLFQAIRDGPGLGGHRPRSRPSPNAASGWSRAPSSTADIVVTATGLQAARLRRHRADRRRPAGRCPRPWPTRA